MKLAPPPRIYSWTDGYVAMKHRAENERGSVTINPDTAAWERWPRTTGSDVIVIAAFFDSHVAAIASASGSHGLADRWMAALAEIERHASTAFDSTYPANRDFWRTLASVAVHLASLELVPPPNHEWQEILSLIGTNPKPRRRNSFLDLFRYRPNWPPPFVSEASASKMFESIEDIYIAQFKYLTKTRGVDRVGPDVGDTGGVAPIPRATNEDVLQLAEFWGPILDSANMRRTFDAPHVLSRWRAVDSNVRRIAGSGDPSALYPHSNAFFRALDSLVIHVAAAVELFTEPARVNPEPRNGVLDLAALGVKWPPPFGPFPPSQKLDDLYGAQYGNLRKLRGADPMPPDPGTSGGTLQILRLTNGDTVQLADFWTPILSAARKESGHSAVKQRWDAELAHVEQLARKGDADARYPKANSFIRALDALVVQASAVAELPSDWDRFKAAVVKSVKALPENLSKVVNVVSEGLSDTVDAAAKKAGGLLTYPLLIGGGVLAAYLLLRNGDRSPRSA